MIFSIIRSNCLSNNTLDKLGYTTIKSEPEILSNATICSDLFKTTGICVDIDELIERIEQKQDDLTERIEIQEDVSNMLDKIKESVNTDANKVGEIQIIQDEIPETQNDCLQSLDVIQIGIECYLVSGEANVHTLEEDNGVTVFVDSTSTGNESQECVPWYDAMCLIGTGVSVTTDIHLDDDTFR